MLAEHELQEYLAEIRKEVCSRCVERPAGGPPCVPLGKECGVEMHLPELIEAVHQVHSDSIVPYLECNREHICEHCTLYGNVDVCPCPMDTLAVLVVQAIEAVDERLQSGPRQHALPTLSPHPHWYPDESFRRLLCQPSK
jgi:hypothetical protein